MATPRKPNTPRHPRTPPSSQRTAAPQSTKPELVDPRWLLKALGIIFVVALLCAWGTLCLLWYQGQWQLVLHPSRNVATTPASIGLRFTDLHFADDATGLPQLNGWLIPAASADTLTPSAPTALLLHGADGSIADALPHALTLHNAGLNVLLFDYRGYGRSVGHHPTETTMQQDSEAALNWLISTQHIAPQNIILYGHGLGASLAATLAAEHHDIRALILDEPDGDLLDRVAHDPHSSLVPARLLFNQDFPLTAPLLTLTTPKLIITYATDPRSRPVFPVNMSVELPTHNDPALVPSIQRFLDLYVTHTTPK